MAGVFGAAKYSKNFEINLDTPFVVFYGDQHEAEPVTLTGTLKLDCQDQMSVRSIKVKLEGKWKVSWTLSGSTPATPHAAHNMIRDKGTLINEEQTIFPAGSTHRIAPGKHEWRFKFVMDPSLPESVEGLNGNYIAYNLTAEIDRGYMSKALLARKHVRIIRTLSQDMTETMPFPYSNEDTWVDKIRYHIYIPSRYYAFGTSVPVEFTLFPLRKGVRVGTIKMEVLERVGLETGKIGEEPYATTLNDKVVASMKSEMPENSTRQLVEPSSGVADESYHFKLSVPLSKSLNSCRQSVNTPHIKIFHNLKIYVNIHNPDGHVSQLCLRNLIHIFISNHTPINDDQSIATPITAIQNPLGSISAAFDLAPPPTYGHHILDQLYQDVDTSGFISGVNTPYHFLSRAQSSENLASFFTTPNLEQNSAEASDNDSPRSSSSIPDAAAVQLRARLQALQDRRPSITSISGDTPPMPNFEFSGPGNNGNTTSPGADPTIILETPIPPASGSQNGQSACLFYQRHRSSLSGLRNSIHIAPSDGTIAPSDLPSSHNTAPLPQRAFDLEALSRIPSYNTAIQTPIPQQNSFPDGLPTYDYAIGLSNPSSPRALAYAPLTPPADDSDIPPHLLSCSTLPNHTQSPPQPPFRDSPSPPIMPGESVQFGSPSGQDYLSPQYLRVSPPQRVHLRGRSIATISELNQREGREQRRPSAAGLVGVGGGNLQTLWAGGSSSGH